jgi:hypothetical protein
MRICRNLQAFLINGFAEARGRTEAAPKGLIFMLCSPSFRASMPATRLLYLWSIAASAIQPRDMDGHKAVRHLDGADVVRIGAGHGRAKSTEGPRGWYRKHGSKKGRFSPPSGKGAIGFLPSFRLLPWPEIAKSPVFYVDFVHLRKHRRHGSKVSLTV